MQNQKFSKKQHNSVMLTHDRYIIEYR